MSTAEILANREYKYGWTTDIESEMIPRGLNEDTVRMISAKKDEPEWMLEFRLKAYRNWLTMKEPSKWPNIAYPKVDYQDIIYYSAPKQKATKASLDEVDPELLRTFEKHVRLRAKHVCDVVAEAGRRAELSVDLTPKMLRHSFATHLMDRGVDLGVIASLMGHRSARETGVYLHRLPGRARAAVQLLSRTNGGAR